MKTFFILAALNILSAYSNGVVEYYFPVLKVDVLCNLEEDICGTHCYNPTTQKCHNSYSSHVVCELDQVLCGLRCTNPSPDEVCIGLAIGEIPTLCPKGQETCLGTCYNPAEQECFDKSVLCSKGQLACGQSCYNPTDPVKCLNTGYSNLLCKADEEICGSWGCYNPQEKTCFPEEGWLCNFGEEICGNTCYNPALGDTCYNSNIVCKVGQELCKNSCYSPNAGEFCANFTRVCKVGEIACGDQDCYDPSTGSKCVEAASDYHLVCSAGTEYCYYNCYNSTTDACLSIEGVNFKKICPIGQEICNGQLNSFTAGYGCYDSSQQECLKGKGGGNVLCNKGEVLCGHTCYTPQIELECLESGILCKPGQVTCGAQCYEAGTKKCFTDIVSDIQWA